MAWFSAFWLPFCRISGAIITAPIFNRATMPPMFRIMLALSLSAVLTPFISQYFAESLRDYDPLSLTGMLMSANEFIIGVCLGLLIQLVFEAFVVAGVLIATAMGLGFATLVDQNQGMPVPVLSQFYMIVILLLFLALNGHLAFLQMLLESFRVWPPGSGVVQPASWQSMLAAMSAMLLGGVAVALPALIALLLVQVAMGVISRSSPSMNLFAVGFPLTMAVGFAVVYITMPTFTPLMERFLAQAMSQSSSFLESLGGR